MKKKRKHGPSVRLLLIVEGRAVPVAQLLREERRRVQQEVLPQCRAGGKERELDAWLVRNALARARAALTTKKPQQQARSLRELRGLVD